MDNGEQRFLFANCREVLLESWQRAYSGYCHIVMTQCIAHLYREKEVFFQGQNMSCHDYNILIFGALLHRSTEQIAQFLVNHIPVGVQVTGQDVMRAGAVWLATLFEM